MSNLREAAFTAARLRAQMAPTTAQQACYFANNAATVMGIDFPNRLGIAAGFDKLGVLGRSAGALGFGCIELGTWSLDHSTCAIQQGIPINCVPAILGVNLNVHDTSELDIEAKLLSSIEKITHLADYISVNVYESHNEASLTLILERVTKIKKYQLDLAPIHRKVLPIILKLHIHPLTNTLASMIKRLESAPIDGIALAFDLGKPASKESYSFWQDPAAQAHACHQLELCRQRINTNIALIAIGGVSQSLHYQDRLSAGVDLVQLHNALVFNDLDVAQQILSKL